MATAYSHAAIGSHHRPWKRNEGEIQISQTELEELQVEIYAFIQWISAWLESDSTDNNPVASIALLQEEITAYAGWMKAWLDTLLIGGSSPSSLASFPSVSTAATSLESILSPPQFPVVQSQTYSNFAFSGSPEASDPFIQTFTDIRAPALTSSTLPSTSSIITPPISQPTSSLSSSYVFDAGASDNVAVYYGQSGATTQTNMTVICNDPSVDIVALAFLTVFFGPNGYPTVNFAGACWDQTSQQRSQAPGLLYCPSLASQIATCQSIGKKVLLSLGGSIATSAFASDSQATQFAETIWNLFGGGQMTESELRPFGDVKVDGFDIDNEDHSTAYYNTFASSLRSQFANDPSKTYYISAAPQCPRPDMSIPLQAMQQADFVFVQFYNNPDCDADSSGFLDSFEAWSSDLSANGTGPKLYLGAPAFDGGGHGYMPISQFVPLVEKAKSLGLSNFGGVMLWDGAEAIANGNFQNGVKAALQQ